MTTDEFNARYKVLKEIAHGNGRSFTAQETASGRAVLVHFLPENMLLAGRKLADTLDQLPARDRSKVLEILTVGKSSVVVTQFLENFESFDLWLQGRVAGGSAPPSSPPQEPALPAGDFTKLFEQSTAAPGPAKPLPPPPPAPGRPPRDSFTELFQTPPEPRVHLHPPPSPATPPVEILRLSIPPSGSSPSPPPPPPPRPAPPMPSWPGALDPPSSPGPLPPLPNPILAAPAQKPRGAEPIIKPPSRDPLPLPPPLPVPGWSGASDYTRQLSAVPAPADPAPAAVAPASEAAPAPAAASRSIVPLLLVLNIVVVIATGVVVYFALKRC
ncbi:MAG TPA: hypothetical protein VIG08_14880 [Gemmatimonadales bacterium]|jgi:hypothetical protein